MGFPGSRLGRLQGLAAGYPGQVDQEIGPGLWQIDTLLGGLEGVNSAFLVRAPRPALVETGPQRDAATVVAALQARGMAPGDLAYLVLTHIHLDHAGGVGELAKAFPLATVVCHPRGVRHLADPTRLVAASAQVYGERLDTLYGRMTPVPRERLLAAEDNQVLDLGAGHRLRLVHSPGHAKHHLAVLDEPSGILLVGDAVGVKLPGGGELRPATPPDDFDRDLAINSLRRFAEIRPQQLVLTHFGPAGEPLEVLQEAEQTLQRWCAVAESAYREQASVDHIESALVSRLLKTEDGDPEHMRAADLLNGARSNAAGLYGWLRRRDEQSSHPGS